MGLRNRMSSLLGKSINTSKFRMLAKLTIVRMALLKKNHQSRSSQAMADVVSLLKSGQHHDALLRVTTHFKSLNDVSFCKFANTISFRTCRDCPEELKEAIHTLIYAASRFGGEFRELQDMRAGFTEWFGKEFADDAVELHKNSQVNLSIIAKLSARQPSLESRKTVLRQIAFQNGIALQLEEEVNRRLETEQLIKEQPEELKAEDFPDSDEEDLLEQRKPSEGYQDVAAAAQEAYESAAYAAVAAREAVRLSKVESQAELLEDSKPLYTETQLSSHQ